MRNPRPRKRGRPPKIQNNESRNYSRSSKVEEEDEDSNQSSSTTNTSSSKYQTRSGRRSQRITITIPVKKRGRKRKREEESEDDEYYYEQYYEEEPPAASEEEEEEESEEDEDRDEFEAELEEEVEEDENDDSRKRLRPLREKAPLFLDDEEIPELSLPSSSDDLLINGKELIRSLSIFEILRHFSHTLRISPFRFEDFCVCLLIDEQTYLFSEIHIQLLKALLREDDLIGTQHGPQDLRDSINLYLYVSDHITWPEVLRIYLSSDLKKNSRIIKECLVPNFPFTTIDKKLMLLEFLCDEFLNTQSARELLNNEGKNEMEDCCRVCLKLNDQDNLLRCGTCPAAFHLGCLDPPLRQAPEDWSCPLCKQNMVTGVTDCITEFDRQMPRQEPIGWDRHGRKYWFLSRRVIVEDHKSGDKVWYYSTRLQFDELLEALDENNYEKELCKVFTELQEEIYRQMAITEKLTKTAKGGRKSYLEAINEELFYKRSSKLSPDGDKDNMCYSNGEKYSSLELKMAVDDEDLRGGVQTRLKTGTIQPRPYQQEPLRSRVNLYNSISVFREEDTVVIWSDDEKSLKRVSRKSLITLDLFKLGLEGNYRNYQNIYSVNPHALNRVQQAEERDRKRHLSHKFSLTSHSELNWGSYNHIYHDVQIKSIYGSRESLMAVLRQALIYLESNISRHFMHPNWWGTHREHWLSAVKKSNPVKEFGLAMFVLESSMKPVIFNSAWNDSLGFTILRRSTQQERDELKKKDKKSRGDQSESSAVDTDGSTSRYYGAGSGLKLVFGKLKHQIWKQKGEEYRLSGIGGWNWLHSARDHSTTKIDHVQVVEEGDEEDAIVTDDVIDISKSLVSSSASDRDYYSKVYGETAIDGFLELRKRMARVKVVNNEDDKKAELAANEPAEVHYQCYSVICDSSSQCYSPLCLMKRLQQGQDSAIIDDSELQEPVNLHEVVTINGKETLKSKKLKFQKKNGLPPSSRFYNGESTRSFMILSTYEMSKLGRTGGQRESTCFNYNCKLNNSVWPYGLTPRPYFRTAWLFRTHNITDLHCIALQLKVLWASIRWDDLVMKPPLSGVNTFTTEIDVTTFEILKTRQLPPHGLRAEYMIRKIVVPIDLPVRTREVTSTPNRSGLRERRRPESPQNKGPKATEYWVAEEELELWEIKQFNEKAEKAKIIERQKKLAQERQNQSEILRKRNEESRQNETNRLVTTSSNLSSRFGNLFQSRASRIITQAVAASSPNTSASNLSSNSAQSTPLAIQTSSGQAIRLQTLTTKPTQQYIIRTGTQLITTNSPNAATATLLNNVGSNTGRNGSLQTTTYLVRSPSLTTRPIIISNSTLNGPIAQIRPMNSNIRQAIPLIATTSTPKKIGTMTTGQAILTSTPIKTATTLNSVSGVNSPSVSSTSTLSTVNATLSSGSKLQCIPIKTNDGRTHLLPITSINNAGQQTMQIQMQSGNQYRLTGQSKSILMTTNQVIQPNQIIQLSNINNQKVILQTNCNVANQIKTNTLPAPVTTQQVTPIVTKTAMQTNQVVTSASSLIPSKPTQLNKIIDEQSTTLPSTNEAESQPLGEEKAFVVTSEMTQEIVRNALLNANMAPEIQQKLIALQRHHQEQAEAHKHPQRHYQSQTLPSTTHSATSAHSRQSTNANSNSRSRSSNSRYSRFDNDDFIYDYPKSNRTPRGATSEEDDINRACNSVIRFLLDRLEKDEKRAKHRELQEERRHKKAQQLKLKIRNNHIEVVRRNILRRKAQFNNLIKKKVEKELDVKISKLEPPKEEKEIQELVKKVPTLTIKLGTPKTNTVRVSGIKRKMDDSHQIAKSEHSLMLNHKSDSSTTLKVSMPPPETLARPSKRARNSSVSCEETPKRKNRTDITDTEHSKQKRNRSTGKKSSPPKKKDGPTLYCICRRPYDNSYMIGCDSCGDWFHPGCINVDALEVSQRQHFYCHNCSKNMSFETNASNESNLSYHNSSASTSANSNAAFAELSQNGDINCFCGQENGSFSMFCVKCSKRFHGRCLGITFWQADKSRDEYICPVCDSNNRLRLIDVQPLNKDHFSKICKFLISIRGHKNAWPFLMAVNKSDVPDYYDIIREPVDLSLVEKRISNKEYYCLGQFIYDLEKMMDNCQLYNKASTIYYDCAEKLRDYFHSKVNSLRSSLNR